MIRRIKIALVLAYFWLFNRREYKRAIAFRKACRTPEVQKALKQVVKACIDKVVSESEK